MSLTTFDIDKNFWEVNPVFKIPKVFKELYNSDKSDGKMESSRIMWALALVYDYDSKFSAMREEERLFMITRDYMGNENYAFKKELVDGYNKLQMDAERRMIQIWDQKIDEIADVIKNYYTTSDNIEELTKVLLNSQKLLKEKEQIEKRIEKKISTEKNRANIKESFLESYEE